MGPVPSRPHEPSPLARLSELDGFFDRAPLDAPNDDEPFTRLLQPVLELREELRRSERRIAFFGAFKSGKSTLLNALIGAPLLPVRAHRATGVVTTVRYGPQPSVDIIRRGGEGRVDQSIPFDDAARLIVRDAEGGESDIEEVRIAVPLPLLTGGSVLVDTPGLLDDELLSDRTRQEIERCDLAVMVLAADKILSAREREVAAWANDLLRGNVVFVVNRLDLVDEEEREDVLEWTRRALAGTGNEMVGRPRIFATAAPRSRGPAPGGRIAILVDWLTDLFTADQSVQVAAVSRLGILAERLAVAEGVVRAELEVARDAGERARSLEMERLAREKTTIRREIARCRGRLVSVRERSGSASALGERFVADCVAATQPQLQASGPTAPLRLQCDLAMERYLSALSDEVAEALAGAPITVPRFELRDWILRIQVDPARERASDLAVRFGELVTRPVDGGTVGREAGATIGGWIDRTVLGVDAAKRTLERVEAVAREVLALLQVETDRYLAVVEGLLAEAEAFYGGWTRSAPEVEAAERHEAALSRLVQWCEGFRRAVERELSVLAPSPDDSEPTS